MTDNELPSAVDAETLLWNTSVVVADLVGEHFGIDAGNVVLQEIHEGLTKWKSFAVPGSDPPVVRFKLNGATDVDLGIVPLWVLTAPPPVER